MTAEIVQQTTLEDLERVIERGVQTFVEVGLALMEVRDRKLYQDVAYTSFEHYCYGRWGFKYERGRQLIEAAQTAKAISGTTPTVVGVPNERQARELAPLAREDPEQAREVWREVNETNNGHVTASKIREAVREHFAGDVDDDAGWEPDPRIDDLKSAIRTLERCQRVRSDAFAVGFRNAAGQLRQMLRDMETSEAI